MKQKHEVVWKILFLLVSAAVHESSCVTLGGVCTVEVAVATSCLDTSILECTQTQCNDTLQAIINAINSLSIAGVTINVQVHSACNVTDFDQCHTNASCSSVSDSDYACSCDTGLHSLVSQARPGSECLANACEAGVDNCTATGSICIDTETSFRCECEEPYRGDGYNCTKIVDECVQNYAPVCSEFANCTNDPSGVNHTCACLDGYAGDGVNCTNVDECTAGQPCHANATCTDTVGSFNCTCDAKHIGDGKQSCIEATVVNCSGTDSTEFDRLEAWGENCNTVCLLPCNYAGENYVTDGECMDLSGNGSSASCVNDALVCDDTTDLTGQFTNDPTALFNPVAVCTDTSIGITVDRCGMNQVSYTLSNTYMGGNAADAVLGDNPYNNVSACQGAVYFNVGRQYSYSAALYPSLGNTCGTEVFALNSTHFEFRNTLRGFLEIDAGPAVIQRHFQVNLKCVYSMTSALVSEQLRVLNLTRRHIEYDNSIVKTGYLETGLWGDKNAETEIQMPVTYAKNLYVSFRYVSESIRKPKIHIRRCWATPTKNADSQKSRDIYRDSCLGDAIAGNEMMEHENRGLLSFSTFTFGDDSDSIYVYCETKICSGEVDNCAACDEDDDSTPPPILVRQRIGPIVVRNRCDDKYNGGCQHTCKLSEDRKVVCYCRNGYQVDITDPTKCLDKSQYLQKFISNERKKHVIEQLLSESYGFSSNAVIFYAAFFITAILIVIVISSMYISSNRRKDFIMDAM